MKKLLVTLNISLSNLYGSKQINNESEQESDSDIKDNKSAIKEDEEANDEPPQFYKIKTYTYIY